MPAIIRCVMVTHEGFPPFGQFVPLCGGKSEKCRADSARCPRTFVTKGGPVLKFHDFAIQFKELGHPGRSVCSLRISGNPQSPKDVPDYGVFLVPPEQFETKSPDLLKDETCPILCRREEFFRSFAA